MIPVDRRRATAESPSPEEFAQSQMLVHDLREQILADPRARGAYDRVQAELEGRIAMEDGPTEDRPTWDPLVPSGGEDEGFWNVLSIWSQDWNSLEDATNLF